MVLLPFLHPSPSKTLLQPSRLLPTIPSPLEATQQVISSLTQETERQVDIWVRSLTTSLTLVHQRFDSKQFMPQVILSLTVLLSANKAVPTVLQVSLLTGI